MSSNQPKILSELSQMEFQDFYGRSFQFLVSSIKALNNRIIVTWFDDYISMYFLSYSVSLNTVSRKSLSVLLLSAVKGTLKSSTNGCTMHLRQSLASYQRS